MFGRYVNVIVTPRNDPENKVVFAAHRIDFEVRQTIGWAADTATISIFNLSVDEMKFLQSKEFGDMDIELRAGYIDSTYGSSGLDKSFIPNSIQVVPEGNKNKDSSTIQNSDTLFSGVITNAVGFKRVPEHIFTMFCLSKAAFSGTTFSQMKDIPAGSNLRQAIVSMCDDYGYGTISTFGINAEDWNVILPNGRVFHDTFINEFTNLLGEYNLAFRITTGEVQIFPDTYADKDAVSRMARDRSPIKLGVDEVIGNPIAGIATLRLDTFVNSGIQAGMVLDVTELLGDSVLINGVVNVTDGGNKALNYSQSLFRYAMSDMYLIQEVVHSGSTHAIDFRTSLATIIGGATAMGGNELSWQSAYAASGMAMEG
ncbi:hypothetical protein HOT32_gp64 [Erwinia phage Faunus]|uniref:Uncharacterized protein n=1 Tax=Erwinia phage Faunus TaxID=2182346 RepID=A0A2U8UWZ7_9CAUD|nr:hypothetical protein HOT32_gp64 [Erwinia phage Faunus]AWN08647.1 hypothetical protein [Erwinia phage Faunus]